MKNDPWPFDQARNVTAITTKQVLEDKFPILRVTHYADDHSWAFVCGTTNTIADGRVICMESALSIDPTLVEITDLPPGYCAQRASIGAPWQRMQNEDDESLEPEDSSDDTVPDQY